MNKRTIYHSILYWVIIFMKKIIFVIVFLIIITNIKIEDKVEIPDESIRFRIIANSNNEEDQVLKMRIVNDLSKNYFPMVSETNINNARLNIEENRELLESRISLYTDNYSISYGSNYFPEKKYHGILYDEGNYESVVVNLGNSKGDNFWCVLFPPLCLLEGTDNNTDDVEYRSLVKDILDKM